MQLNCGRRVIKSIDRSFSNREMKMAWTTRSESISCKNAEESTSHPSEILIGLLKHSILISFALCIPPKETNSGHKTKSKEVVLNPCMTELTPPRIPPSSKPIRKCALEMSSEQVQQSVQAFGRKVCFLSCLRVSLEQRLIVAVEDRHCRCSLQVR